MDDLDSTERPINNQLDTIDVTFYIQAYKADSPQFPSPWTPSDPGMYRHTASEQSGRFNSMNQHF